jgi:predicted negative regulator of RcsB-dependent stress response
MQTFWKEWQDTIILIIILILVLVGWRNYVFEMHKEHPERYDDIDAFFGVPK